MFPEIATLDENTYVLITLLKLKIKTCLIKKFSIVVYIVAHFITC